MARKKNDLARGTEHKKQLFLAALEASMGVIDTACKATKIDRNTIYWWIDHDEKFKAKIEEIKEIALDFAESMLYLKIKGMKAVKYNKKTGEEDIYEIPPDTTSILFYLKCKGRGRGYIDTAVHDINIKEIPKITLKLPTKEEINNYHATEQTNLDN